MNDNFRFLHQKNTSNKIYMLLQSHAIKNLRSYWLSQQPQPGIFSQTSCTISLFLKSFSLLLCRTGNPCTFYTSTTSSCKHTWCHFSLTQNTSNTGKTKKKICTLSLQWNRTIWYLNLESKLFDFKIRYLVVSVG